MPNIKGYKFGVLEASSLAKTRMTQPNGHSTTFNFGRCIPIYIRETVPGDVISHKTAGLIRMSVPVAPIMTGIHGSVHSFFVPKRLVWEHMKEFYGESPANAGPNPLTYTYPHRAVLDEVKAMSAADYLGYPLALVGSATANVNATLNVLPIRAYWSIINEYYRKPQVMDPWIVDLGDTGAIATRGGVSLTLGADPAKSLKNFDMFTTCTIAPVFGGETTLPIASYAPVVSWLDLFPGSDYDDGYHKITNPGFANLSDQVGNPGYVRQILNRNASINDTQSGMGFVGSPSTPSQGNLIDGTNLFTDLSNATSTKLNDLYLAMAVEKWKYHANFGNRYFERLEVSYGVRNPDLVLSRPEHLGEYRFDINVQTVIQTAQTGEGDLGNPGANSATAFRHSMFNHSFGETGYIIDILTTYHDETYYGADNMLLKKDVLDDYWPEFVNRGDMGIKVGQLYFDNGATYANNDQIFGFNEAYANERWSKTRASGLFNPYVDTNVNSSQARIPGFILAAKWNNAPSLNEAFLTVDRTSLTDALTSGVNGPDFLADFYFDDVVTRSITPRSRPGIPTDLR